MNALDTIEVLTRTKNGPWLTVKGTVGTTFVSVDIPASRLDGLSESQELDQMKRALRAGLPYAR